MENKEVVEKNNQKQKSKKSKQKAKIAGIIIVHVVAVSSIIGLSVALAYSEQNYSNAIRYRNDMEYYLSRTYYDLNDQVNKLDVDMKKLNVSEMSNCQLPLLFSIWNGAKAVSKEMTEFASLDENFLKAQKFVNQLGEYSYSLAMNINENKTQGLSIEEKAKMNQLAKFVDVMKEAVIKMENSMANGKTFLDRNGILNEISDVFNGFGNSALEYPEMIYDGPFSDSLDNQTTYGVNGKEITEEEGKTIIKEIFGEENVKSVEFLGETKSKFSTYNYDFSVDGKRGMAQLTRQGGKLINYDLENNGGQDSANLSCIEQAQKFAEKAGYKNLTEVWTQHAGGICYVNFAPTQNGVILYSDLIKIKLDGNSKMVTGFDAVHYLTNHRVRKLEKPIVTESQARAKITLQNVSAGRLTLIPFKQTKEVLTYEFRAENQGVYYIYINALTGNEQNILYVIDTPNGIAVQ